MYKVSSNADWLHRRRQNKLEDALHEGLGDGALRIGFQIQTLLPEDIEASPGIDQS